jgi:hypothetical protein
MDQPITEGGCLCGAIRYRVKALPIALSLCHCNSCRRAAGAPSVAWVVLHSNALEFVTGTPQLFRSSPGVVRSFCGRCGTSLTYQRELEPDTIDVTTASLDRADAFPPTREIWIGEKLVWEALNGAMPTFPGSSRSRPVTAKDR